MIQEILDKLARWEKRKKREIVKYDKCDFKGCTSTNYYLLYKDGDYGGYKCIKCKAEHHVVLNALDKPGYGNVLLSHINSNCEGGTR
jgi:hypothetical protein